MAHFQILLAPALAVMGIAFLFNLVLHRVVDRRSREYAIGLLFGGAIVIGMTNPLVLAEGFIFDTRSLLLGAAVVYGGPIAGLIAMAFGLVCRFWIGGAGLPAGIVGLVMAYGLAILCAKWINPLIRSQYLADAALGLVVSLSIFALFALPLEIALSLIGSVGPKLFLSNIVGMVVLGIVFRRELALEKARMQLQDDATRDPLTNLLNRRGLQSVVERRRFNPRVGQAMLYFDVDNFKSINDSYSHDIGDAVLEVIASRINENLRDDAIFARQGGDEFSIYLPEIGQGDVKAVAERICDLIGQDALIVRGQSVKASISLGGYWSRANFGLDELIKRADAQLRLAKSAGKNRTQIAFDPKSAIASVA